MTGGVEQQVKPALLNRKQRIERREHENKQQTTCLRIQTQEVDFIENCEKEKNEEELQNPKPALYNRTQRIQRRNQALSDRNEKSKQSTLNNEVQLSDAELVPVQYGSTSHGDIQHPTPALQNETQHVHLIQHNENDKYQEVLPDLDPAILQEKDRMQDKNTAVSEESEVELGRVQDVRKQNDDIQQPIPALDNQTDQVQFIPHTENQNDEDQLTTKTSLTDKTLLFLEDLGVKKPTLTVLNKGKTTVEILEQVKNATLELKEMLFREPLGENLLRYSQKSAIGRAILLCRHNIFPSKKYVSRKKTSSRRRMADYKRRAVDEFLRRDDNSYTLPDKKHYRKDHGVPIVALVDCMRNLHRKFVVETNLALSFSTFCKARDRRTVKTSVFLKRSVCLCKPHANMGMMLEAVDGLPSHTSQLVLLSDGDVEAALDSDTAKYIKFKRWEKKRIWYGKGKKKKKVYHTELNKLCLEKEKFKKKFMKSLKSFRKHHARVGAQYEAIKTLKANLPARHVICQMDYAENWPTGFFAEIQSAFFGKDQITLHPMVVYVKPSDLKKKEEEEEAVGPEQEASNPDGDPQQPTTDPLKNFNYVGVSEVTKHSFATTFTFLVHLLHEIRGLVPDLEHLHLVTDSPTSQYRNRYACDMLQRAANIFGIRITWNWLEAGHGKGPCDGIGGALKGLADRTVKICGAIQSVDEFIQEIQPRTQKLHLLKASKSTIEINQQMINSWKSRPVNGILKIHQATVHEENLFLRKTSCYNDCCLTTDLRPNCEEWKKYHKKSKQQEKSSLESQSSSDSEDEMEEELEEREAEEDTVGGNECTIMEAQFSSDEDSDDAEYVHNSHRTITRRSKFRKQNPLQKEGAVVDPVAVVEMDSGSENEEYEPDKAEDKERDNMIREQRRAGNFVNELREDESSSDEWPVQDTQSIQWCMDKGFL